MSQNVMTTVDLDAQFMVVIVDWEGSAHDQLVLRRSLKRGFTIPEGRYYLVDEGCTNTHQFLSPYRGKTYHLAQFQQRRCDNRYDGAKELFNHRHVQLRNIIEKTFGILKDRFKIRKEIHNYKYDFQTNVVIACCVLHNFILQHKSLQDDIEDDCDGDLGEDNDGSSSDSPSTLSNDAMADVSRGTNAQRGGALRDSIRDELWNKFHNNEQQ